MNSYQLPAKSEFLFSVNLCVLCGKISVQFGVLWAHFGVVLDKLGIIGDNVGNKKMTNKPISKTTKIAVTSLYLRTKNNELAKPKTNPISRGKMCLNIPALLPYNAAKDIHFNEREK